MELFWSIAAELNGWRRDERLLRDPQVKARMEHDALTERDAYLSSAKALRSGRKGLSRCILGRGRASASASAQ